MKPDGLRMLGWAIPILCMAVAGWVLYKQHDDFSIANLARNQAHRDNENAAKEYQAYQDLPPETRFAAADDVPEEETTFLTFLRTRTAADHVNFKNWSSQTIEYGKDKQAAPKDPQIAELLKGLRKISGALTFTGSYSNIRKLVGELESSDHLYTLSNITWTTTKDGTQLAMTISRYVAPALPAPPKASETPKPTKPTTLPPGHPGIHVTVTQSPTPAISPGVTTKP